MTVPIDAGIVADFRRDGAVCVRQAFSPQMVALATDAIEANLAALSPNAKRASGDDDGAFIEDFCNWQRIEPMRRFIEQSPAAVIAGALMGTSVVRLYHDHVLVKEPGTSQRTPWHQDLPYYNVDGQQNVSMWFPVDPVAVESTLQFVAGSHRGPWYMPRSFLDGQAKWFPDGTLAELPPIDDHPERFRVLRWSLEPGDAVFFHMLTLHAAGGVGRPAPACPVGALPRRRHGARPAPVGHLAAVPRPRRRARRRRADGPPALPDIAFPGHAMNCLRSCWPLLGWRLVTRNREMNQ